MSKTKLPEETRTLVKDRSRDRRGQMRCATCNRPVAKGGYEIDHIVAEENSTPEMRDDPANLQVLCSRKKDDPLGWGCHQQKSAREAREWARINAGPRSLTAPLCLSGLAVTWTGWGYLSLLTRPPFDPDWWLYGSAGVFALALSTYLVQNGFRSRRPQENLSADRVLREEAGLDTVRAAAAVREIVGARGEVHVTSPTRDQMVISYPGTGFNDSTDGDDRAKLIAKMNAKMGGRWRAHWDTVHDTVRMVLRPALPERVLHPGLTPGRPWHVLPVADGIHFDLNHTSHLLIIGVTNMGKTSLIRAIIVAACDSASRGEVELTLADPKMIELLGFEGWPGVRHVVTEDIALWDMAIDLEAEMRERFRLAKIKGAGHVPLSAHKRLLVIMDEYEQYYKRMRRLWQNGNPDHQGPKAEDPYRKQSGQVVPPPIDAMQTVLAMARRCGIHVVIGTQSPDSTWFGGTGTRQNLQGRAAVGPIGPEQAKMAFGDTSIGRDLPPEAKGRTTIQMLDGEAEEIQSWWVPDPSNVDGDLTPADWALLAKVGMPKELIRL